MSEKIGRHKGAVETLLHEKKELSRILQIVNSQLERHLQELEDEGIDTDAFIDSLLEEGQEQQKQERNSSKRSQNSGNSRSTGNQDENTRSLGGDRSSRGSDSGSSSSGSRDFSPSR